MAYLYLACLLVSVGALFWLKLFDVRNSTTQVIIFLCAVASNLGYFMVTIAKDLESAIVAQIVSYVGGMFLPAFFLFLVMEICHVKLHRAIGMAILLLQTISFAFVCTIGHSDLFYKGASIIQKNGVTILLKDYGPLHILCPLTMVIYIAAAFIIIIYTVLNNKSVNRRGIIAMFVLALFGVVTYGIERLIHFEYELIPVSYCLIIIGTLIPVYDSNLYTVYENEAIIAEQLERVGFLTFDKKKIYKGCDKFMEEVFPELKKFEHGQKISGCSDGLKKLINQIKKVEDKVINSKGHVHVDIEPFSLNGRYYIGSIHIVSNAIGVHMGYTIELRDDTEHHNALELKEHYNEELSAEVHAATRRIRSIQQKTIIGMARMVESRDLSTGGHIKRTSDVVRIIAKKLEGMDNGLDKHFLRLVIRSAPMHDIGKIGVDDAILRKQGKFTDDEYATMKKHAEIGYHMVSEILSDVEEPDFVKVAENVAHYHHEKVDGTGYPCGLKGDEIPVEARIMALADVFDALVSKRCYKEAFSYDKAFSIIEHDAGTHFDAELAKVFLSCRRELEDYYDRSEE
ncbi:MAG: HD domain-containing protein [Clostridia bacterium]|nr:HD domain-containing protein [Clostridia bacterium]